MRVGRCRAVVLALLVLACGGKVEPGDGRGGAGGTPPAEGSRGAGGRFGNPQELDPCELGFLRSEQPSRRCPWLAKGRCYDTKDHACACICPTDHVSTCMSDFPGADGPVNVDCI